MDKSQFENLIKPLVDIYDEIELEIIQNILKKLDNYTSISGSIEWYLEKLNDLGVLHNDTKKIIKAHKIAADKIIKELSNKTVSSMDDFGRLKQYYEQDLIDTNPIDLFNSVSMNNLMNNATKDVFDIMKLIDSKVLEGTDEAYKKILNKAYVETASGIYTYQESIRNALKDFAKEGIRTVHYDNGKTLSIEAVVRRDVITRVNKLVGDINLNNAKELGTNLVYVNQHEGARVRTPYMKHDYEAHAEWQGKIYMIEGSNEKYGNFYEKTGYGEMLGLKGLNCYHDFRPFFEWETIPERIDEEENQEKRELLDKQRIFERKIRQLRREKEVYKQIDKEEYKSTCNKLKSTNNKYNKFLENNNLNRDYSREYVANNLKVKTPEFNEEFFSEFEELDTKIEHFVCYDISTNKIVGNITHGSNNTVSPDIPTLWKILTAKKDSLIGVHNHPKNTSFSIRDMVTFNDTRAFYGIAIRTDDYIYTLTTGVNGKIKGLNSEKQMRNIYDKIKVNMAKENLTLIERRHKINTLFAKEMGWNYGRIKNDKSNN